MAGSFTVGSITAKLRLDDNEFVKAGRQVVNAARRIGRDVKTALGKRNTVEFIETRPVLNQLSKIARGVRRFGKKTKAALKDAFNIRTGLLVRGFKRLRSAGVRAAERIKRAARGIATPFRLLRRTLFSLQGAFLALGVAVGGAALIERAKNVEVLTASFENLSRSVGAVSGTFLGQLRKATKGAVSDLELIKTTNNAVLLGVVKSQEEFAEFASLARQLGRAVGRDAVEAINDLTIGVGRQSRLILDNLGLIVKVEAATEGYAASLGVAVSSLTDAERRTAFYNATIDSARKKVAELGPDTDTLADSIGRFRAEISNTASLVATAFVRGGPFDSIAKFLKENRTNILAFAQFVSDAVRSLITRIGGLVADLFGSGGRDRFVKRLARFVTDAFRFLNELIRQSLGALFSRLGVITLALIGQLLLSIVVAIPAFIAKLFVELESALIKGALRIASSIPGLSSLLGLDDEKGLQEALDAVDEAGDFVTKKIDEAQEFLNKGIDSLMDDTITLFEEELVVAVEKATEAMRKFGDEGPASANKIKAAFGGIAADLQKAAQRFSLTRSDPIAGERGLTLQRELKGFQDRFNQLQKIRAQAIQDFPELVGEKQVKDSAKVLADLRKQIEALQKTFLDFVKAPKAGKAALQTEFLKAAQETALSLEEAGPKFLTFGARIASLVRELEGSTPRITALLGALKTGADQVVDTIDLSAAIDRATRPVFLGEQAFNKVTQPFAGRRDALKLEVALEGVDEAVLDARKLELAIEPFASRLSPAQKTRITDLLDQLRQLGKEKSAKATLVAFRDEVRKLDDQLLDFQKRTQAVGLSRLDGDFASLSATLEALRRQFPDQDFEKVEKTFTAMGVALAEARIAERAAEARELNVALGEIGLTQAEQRLAAIAREAEVFEAALRRAGLPLSEINRLLAAFQKQNRKVSEATVFAQFQTTIEAVKRSVKELERETGDGSPIIAAQEAFRESTRESTEEAFRLAETLLVQAEAAGADTAALEKLRAKVADLKDELEAANDAGAKQAGDNALKKRVEEQGKAIGASLERNVGRGLINAFRRGESISKQWSSIASGFFEDAMNDVIKRLSDTIGTALSSVLENIGLGSGAAGLVTGLLGVAGAIFGALESKSSSTVDDFDTAINSSEAVRGVVAGPSNVAIAKVGDSLKEALRTTEVLLERIAIGVERGVGSGGGGSGGAALSGNGAGLLSTSTAT